MEMFFKYSARLVIIFAVLIIICAVVFSKPQEQKTNNKTITLSPVIRTTLTSVKINLEGPLKCQFYSGEATISAYIKNKKILIGYVGKKENDNYLLKDDCLYIWSNQINQGKKICGLSQYVNIAENLFNNGLLSFDSLVNIMSQANKSQKIPLTEKETINLLQSCKKQMIEDIIFNEPKKMPWLRPTFPSR